MIQAGWHGHCRNTRRRSFIFWLLFFFNLRYCRSIWWELIQNFSKKRMEVILCTWKSIAVRRSNNWLLSDSFAVINKLPLKPAKPKLKVLTGMKAFLKVFPYVFENQLSLLIVQLHLQSMLPVIAKFLKFITSFLKK